jgi:hypothetical protein
MRTALVITLAICFTFAPLFAQDSAELFSPDQLDNLLAPIALYPDPLLAQVLPAATFVDQIDEASRMLRGNADPRLIDAQPWDVSVQAVAHYPIVLNMMSDKLDWTTAVGQAYVNQPDDVMASIQRLRAMALADGNLVSNQDQEVAQDGDYISIDPIQPQYIFVPVYDPGLVYYRRGGNFLSFGAGLPIGAWLNYDFNWRDHKIFYHGWENGHANWIDRSHRYVVGSSPYVNPRFRTVQVNRGVVRSNVNNSNLDRYTSVHPDVKYSGAGGNPAGNRVFDSATLHALPGNVTVMGNPAVNGVINRNLNSNDPKLDAYRGHQPGPSPSGTSSQPLPSQPAFVPSQPAERGNDRRGAIDPQAASQRGQASRQQMQPLPTQAQPLPTRPQMPQSPPQQSRPSSPGRGGRP